MQDWKTLVAQKKLQLQTAIPDEWHVPSKIMSELESGQRKGLLIEQGVVHECGILSSTEIDITERFTATQLLQKLARGELKAVDVAMAFAKRAAIAQQLTSCLTEIFFEQGIERARWLDSYLKENGKPYGPLHGLPISLKDSFKVKGLDATSGFVALLNKPAAENSPLVDLLLDAGAVLYAKTNIPQTMMTADSENNIFGRCLNPHNTSWTAGGSSGGEGAIVAIRGSVLGVGSDIAGSIRIPSLCCGVYGFKPTPGRVPFGGTTPGPNPIVPNLTPVAGPVATSVQDLELFMRVVAGQHPPNYDDATVPIPWRYLAAQPVRKLTIGVLAEDPKYPLHPPVQRALASAVRALEKAGNKLVRLPNNPSLVTSLGTRIAYGYFGLMGPLFRGDLIKEAGEPLVTSVARGYHPFVLDPPIVQPDAEWKELLTELAKARGAYCDAWRKTWLEHALDVVMAPGAQNTAVKHDTYGLPPYTVMWNVLDYPGCIVPYGKASKIKDPEPTNYGVPFQPEYDPDSNDGAPCVVQIVAPKFKDEECLWAADIIDGDLKNFS